MARRFSIIALLVAAWVIAGPVSFAHAEGWSTGWVQTAALPATSSEGTALPRVLSDADVTLYRQIFAAQEPGNWRKADKLIKRLSDKVLMGHVLEQRYMHPTKYRSKYKELKEWMAHYADHPQAKRIYKLAMKRRPKNWRKPKTPKSGYLSGSGSVHVVNTTGRLPRKRLSRANARKAYSVRSKIRHYLRKGWTKSAKHLIRTKEAKKLLSTAEYDQAKARLGNSYFVDGRYEWALSWAGAAAKRSGKYLPEAHWTAGLAAWRLDKKETAYKHFAAVAENKRTSPWLTAAGAFWAARASLAIRKPQDVNGWLEHAASAERTFYGLLARHVLGHPTTFKWRYPPLDGTESARVTARPEGKRALALIQIDQPDLAERELRALAGRTKKKLYRPILALSARAGLPALTVRLDGLLNPKGEGYDGAAYPIPAWKPNDGFKVDRALIYALIRQESGFNPKAKSYAGARGLMQLMPRTAGFVARDKRYRTSKRKDLYKPGLNLSLGQKYIEMLLDDAKVDGDLFFLATAWNGGPGNLSKWRRRVGKINDPLLFIESIPLRETRIFVERVLTNLWIYRDRLGQQAPSLDAVAQGGWPSYIPLDQESNLVARNVENRK